MRKLCGKIKDLQRGYKEKKLTFIEHLCNKKMSASETFIKFLSNQNHTFYVQKTGQLWDKKTYSFAIIFSNTKGPVKINSLGLLRLKNQPDF
jgi:carbamoylphosphate synthase small subunit